VAVSEDQDPWDETTVFAYERWAVPFARSMAEALLGRAAPPRGGSVLDVAAGTGALAVVAAEQGFRVRGIDVSGVRTTC
jgi:2-polyprenyl-3-methyl-5-hydroxy-6-metoxy-1,4-benzoquinol methylase